MPRLPTIRVIGSQDISTRWRPSVGAWRRGAVTVLIGSLLASGLAVRRGVVAGGEPRAAVAPLRLLVDGVVGDRPQGADDPTVEPDQARGEQAAGRLVHEGHELVGEAGHGAGDADAAHVRAAADPVHPAALGDVAVDHRAPA